MKKFSISFLLVLVSFVAFAQQKPLDESRSNDLVAVLTQATANIKSLECKFVQTKQMSMLADSTRAEGKMYYVAPDKIRWEYDSPYKYALVVNGEKVLMQSEAKTEIVDAKSNRMYKGITDIIMGSVTGKKLFDKSAFDVKLFDDGSTWRAELKPLKKDLKRMFKLLTFRFDKKSNLVCGIEFTEISGDVTCIRFSDRVVDGSVDNGLFQMQ